MRKITKILFSIVMVFAMLFSYILPITKVFASDEYVLSFTTKGNHTLVNDNGHLKIDGQYVDLRDANDNNVTIGTVACSDNACTITVSDGTSGKLNYNGDGKFTLYMQGHPTSVEQVFNNNEDFAVQDYEEPHDNDDPMNYEGNQGFDGKAYLIWSCGNGTCYHYFDDIPNFDNGNSTFYKSTTIKADNNQNITFDVNAKYKAFALPDKFDSWVEAYKNKNNVENINWVQVDPEDIISEYPPNMGEWENKAVDANKCTRPAEGAPGDERDAFERCVDDYYISQGNLPFIRLQPLGEPEQNNAYVSYGDRNFKLVIYNENYKGVTMGDLSELHYYPSTWTNAYLRRDQYDISGTTKSNPTIINTILLESTVIIRPLNYNSFAIKSMEALDVPEDAVDISKDNNGEFRLVFSSNFYDNVVFKVTDTNNEVSYLQVSRYTIDGWISHHDNGAYLTADFYFDREREYSDFDLTAKILYKDGTVKNVTLDAVYGIDDGLGNIAPTYQVDEENPLFGPKGKGLKHSTFEYGLENGEEDRIDKVYLNAEYKGSTASTYAGAYVGSGEGTLANIYHPEEGE